MKFTLSLSPKDLLKMKFTLALLGATLLAFLQNVQATPSAAIMQAELMHDGYVVVGGKSQEIMDMDWLMFAKLMQTMHLPPDLLEHILLMVMNGDGCTKPKWVALIIRFRHLMKPIGNKLLEGNPSSSKSQMAASEDANTIDETLKKFLDMNSASPIEYPRLIGIITSYDWDADGFYDVVECYALLELLLVGNGILAWSTYDEDIRHEIHRIATIKGSITKKHLQEIIINLEIEEERFRLLETITVDHIRSAKAFVWRWDTEGPYGENRNGTLSMYELESALQGKIGNDELAAIKEAFGDMANPGGVQHEPAANELEWNELVVFLIPYFHEKSSKFEHFAKLVFVENPKTLAELILIV